MSTPASLKRMEEAKQKAQQRKSTGLKPLGSQVLTPLSNNTNNFTSYRTKNIDFTDDNFTKGRQYTSFEANRVKKPFVKRNNTKAIVVPPKAVEIPLGLATDDYVVDSKKIVCFNGKDHFLSTLYPSAIMIDNHKYLSVEHYYQACKLFSLAGSEHAASLRNVTEPTRAKITAKNILRELNVSTSKIDDWKAAQGILMLIHATAYKFVQNLELRKKLIDTGDAILAQSYDRDTFYACGADKEAVMKWAVENDGQVIKIPSELSLDNMKYVPLVGQGRNVLGVICMKIRKQILDGLSEKKAITVEMFLPPIMNALSMSSVNVAGEQESEDIDINIPSLSLS